jgi:hypothetical protein
VPPAPALAAAASATTATPTSSTLSSVVLYPLAGLVAALRSASLHFIVSAYVLAFQGSVLRNSNPGEIFSNKFLPSNQTADKFVCVRFLDQILCFQWYKKGNGINVC